ncbi:MAG: hypothetical protein JNL41_10305 [Phenylobacterium sp.]|uniref:hypothetical protein n=1 Tax=Phenylobacterium sp. TaxID=1871053 RepID=UPI001A406004|nr:hypothetical protein [Phenylobacterium sp.]MBL8554658.1 hypothetical protein [Phenylobacterium sp.]
MGTYRIYHVASGGRLRLGETFQASSDGEAVMKARLLLVRGQSGELWEAGRIVGRFSDTHTFSPGGG